MEFKTGYTMNFMRKMQPLALRIYGQIFPGCKLEYLRRDNFDGHPKDDPDVHILDLEFAIDSLLRLTDGSFFSLQEKYRTYEHLKSFGDFTQEHMNGFGTKYETKGEWFHLAAQLYFYGWANEDQTDFEEYMLIDVVKYKLLVQAAGGLENIGTLQCNERYGRASFYGICIGELWPAIITYKIAAEHMLRIQRHMDLRAKNKARRERAARNKGINDQGEPLNLFCDFCGNEFCIDVRNAAGDAQCPNCGRFTQS
jgi:hypothetical protein